MIRTRDVTFNEEEIFPGNIQALQDQCIHISLDELSYLITTVQLDEPEPEEPEPLVLEKDKAQPVVVEDDQQKED